MTKDCDDDGKVGDHDGKDGDDDGKDSDHDGKDGDDDGKDSDHDIILFAPLLMDFKEKN